MAECYDVVVVGAGSAGCIAAIAAAREGASTALVEKHGFVGGTPVVVGISSLAPFHFGDQQVVTGIPQELVDRLVEAGGSLGHMKVQQEYGTGSYVCLFDREIYKHVLLEMLAEARVHLWLHSQFIGVEKSGKRISAIVISTPSGVERLEAKAFIDCTGDALVATAFGCPVVVGRDVDGRVQPLTLMFEMANVDVYALWEHITRNMDDIEWWSLITPRRPVPSEFNPFFFVVQGFRKALAKHPQREHLGRNTLLLFTGLRKGVVSFNSTRVHVASPLSAKELSQAEVQGRQQAVILAEWLRKEFPGFDRAFLSWTGVAIGIRESRRIVGHYVLTADDICSGRTFPDSIAKGFFPIDIHDPLGKGGYTNGGSWVPLRATYDIPYRVLIPREVDNLLVAGRCISATHEALGSTRVAPCCMALGQAAGVAAALLAINNYRSTDLPVSLLQDRLRQSGQTL